MEFKQLDISGVWLAISEIHSDPRGNFKEWFKEDELKQKSGESFNVRQANVSLSRKGVIRGIHFSTASTGQAKWVSCLSGSILDVVVDLRKDSKTYLKWLTVELNSRLGQSLLIGDGLGHAFLALEEDSVVSYLLSSSYSPESEHSINPFDTSIGIEWPVGTHTLSERDRQAPMLHEWERNHVK